MHGGLFVLGGLVGDFCVQGIRFVHCGLAVFAGPQGDFFSLQDNSAFVPNGAFVHGGLDVFGGILGDFLPLQTSGASSTCRIPGKSWAIDP